MCGKMNRVLILGILAVVLFSGCIIAEGNTNSVERTLSAFDIYPDDELIVTLHVTMSNESRAYIIDEMYPTGWIVIDTGGLNNDEEGHLKIIKVLNLTDDSLANTTYVYRLKPENIYNTTGKYNFNGVYRMETMSEYRTISGRYSVGVIK